MNHYAKAWKLLNEKIMEKTSWGRSELKVLMLECLIEVGQDE